MNFAPSVSFAPFIIAREEGYFEQEGIDPKIESMEINSALLSVISKKMDVFAGPIRAGIFNLIARGEPLAVVADKGHSAPGPCSADAFVAPPAVADRVIRTRSVRGEKFASPRGGYSDYLIDRMLPRYGADRSSIEFANMPRGGDFLEPGKSKVEAIRYLTEPNLTNALASGLKVIATGEEVIPGHQVSVIVFGPRLLRDEPELGRRFMRAYLRAVAKYNEGKTDRNVAIISSYTKMPPDLIRRMCWQPIAADGRIDPAVMQDFFEWGRSHKYIEADIPESAWWNPSFIDAAKR